MCLSHLHLLPFPPLMGSAHMFTCCRPCQTLSPSLILLPYSSVLTLSIVRPQAAASTTFVQGVLSPQRAKAMSARGRSIHQEGGQRYSAAALSLVFHPAHPLIPTLRADVRRFEVRRCREHAGCAILALKKALRVVIMHDICRRCNSPCSALQGHVRHPCFLCNLYGMASQDRLQLHQSPSLFRLRAERGLEEALI